MVKDKPRRFVSGSKLMEAAPPPHTPPTHPPTHGTLPYPTHCPLFTRHLVLCLPGRAHGPHGWKRRRQDNTHGAEAEGGAGQAVLLRCPALLPVRTDSQAAGLNEHRLGMDTACVHCLSTNLASKMQDMVFGAFYVGFRVALNPKPLNPKP